MDLLALLSQSPGVIALAEALEAGRRVQASGSLGSSTAFVAGAVARLTRRTLMLVVAHLDDADEAVDELVSAGSAAVRLPAMEGLPGQDGGSLEVFAERLGVIRRVLASADGARTGARAEREPAFVVVCPVQALMQGVPDPEQLGLLSRVIRRGDAVRPGDLVRWLEGAGYRRADVIEQPGDFAVRGGIVDVFTPGGGSGVTGSAEGVPARLDFLGDEVEGLREIDLDTMGSDRALEQVELVAADAGVVRGQASSRSFVELLPAGSVAIIHELSEVMEQARGYYERALDARGIFGPPGVMRLIGERCHGVAHVSQYSKVNAGVWAAEQRVELPVAALPTFATDAGSAIRELLELAGDSPGEERAPEPAPEPAPGGSAIGARRAGGGAACRVDVVCQTEGERQRFGELLRGAGAGEGSGRIAARVGYVHRGFVWNPGGVGVGGAGKGCAGAVAVVPYHELVHRYVVRRRGANRAAGLRSRGGRAIEAFLEVQPGDYVVHAEHGIARFVGLKLMKPRGARGAARGGAADEVDARSPEAEEYLTLEFAGGAHLHVPAARVDQVQKYIGGFSGKPPLSALGGQRWRAQKARVAESVRDLAAELLRVRAARESLPGVAYPADTAWQAEFEAEFPYEETDDQVAALAEIKRDMQAPRPADRLICGDVGFGKTELAIRAAFKAVEFGKQVAVLVPTTVLCEQHERTFRSRFAGYPFRVESVSRFKTGAEATAILEDVRRGRVDVIIGTHRLLSRDVEFADLGLVIVDEEQRFGVEHKEALLRLRLTVDVLTLSATPIPRTLHMAMLGIRDISSLATPPLDRRAIVTEVIPYNARRVAEAIARELARDGQVFYVHNRVHSIRSVADDVQRLAPGARVVFGHGQMPPGELEDVMLRFMRREADILVSTTIIESGIDIPTANTMIVADADRFGLAELHQLRGRVGRSKHRAYCYLLLPESRPVSEVAMKRLRALEQYSMLGAGFKIAMRDLEIRGAGNILGAEQSGHIAAVGYDMYCRVLEEAVRELRHEPAPARSSDVALEVGLHGMIPRTYIPSDARRLEAYRRIASASDAADVARVASDMAEAYGTPPTPTQRLLELAELRTAAASAGIRSITLREKDVVIRTRDPVGVAERLRGAPGDVVLLPGKPGDELHEVYYRPTERARSPQTLVTILRRRLAGGGGDAPAIAAPADSIGPAADAGRPTAAGRRRRAGA